MSDTPYQRVTVIVDGVRRPGVVYVEHPDGWVEVGVQMSQSIYDVRQKLVRREQVEWGR